MGSPDLAVSLIVSESRVSRLMQSMISKGLVRRETNGQDRWAIYALLIDEGRAAYDRTVPHFADLLNRNSSQKLAEADLGEFIRILSGIVRYGAPKKGVAAAARKETSAHPWFETATKSPFRIVGEIQLIHSGQPAISEANEEVLHLEIIGDKRFSSHG